MTAVGKPPPAKVAVATGIRAWFRLAHRRTAYGRKIPVIAEQLHGAERDQAWQQIIAAAPRFAQYEKKTDRELPVIRLVPQSTLG